MNLNLTDKISIRNTIVELLIGVNEDDRIEILDSVFDEFVDDYEDINVRSMIQINSIEDLLNILKK